MSAFAPAFAAAAFAAAFVAQPAGAQADARRSGYDFMGPATQALQRDDSQNPAMLWVADGEALWRAKAGAADKACADCHGDARTSMRGVAARYPAFDAQEGRPIDLAQRIDRCVRRHQQAEPHGPEHSQRLALESYVALQSRGLPIAPPADPRLDPWRERGRALWAQRIGQLDLACSQCHDAQATRRLGGSVIPQAHPTGYPIYRLEWQSMGSLERRLRACMSGVRAETLPYGDPDLVALQVFLASRAAGMTIETPGVRP